MAGVFFRVTQEGKSQSGKTGVFTVRASGGAALGEIKWFAAWRRYCFFPMSGTIFDEACLKELASSCVRLTDAHTGRVRT